MHIQSIPMWTGSGDNYAYLVVDEASKDALIIDPAHPVEVLPVLEPQTDEGKINLTGILNTHYHKDHAGGNDEMLQTYPNLPITGGKDCLSVTATPTHNSVFKLGHNVSITALHTPCHTQDSICYYMQDGDQRVVFTGDTLFIGGCGRFFEGTPAEMHHALNEILAELPGETKVYPGHEYTKTNLLFATSILPHSAAVAATRRFADQNAQTTGHFSIADQKEHNVFMRPLDPAVQKAVGVEDPVGVVGKLRELKDKFKG